jgi:hypothetical protein
MGVQGPCLSVENIQYVKVARKNHDTDKLHSHFFEVRHSRCVEPKLLIGKSTVLFAI